MRISFVVTPACALPEGVAVAIVEGDSNVILQLSDQASTQDLAAGLTCAVTAYAEQAWRYIGAEGQPSGPARLRAVD